MTTTEFIELTPKGQKNYLKNTSTLIHKIIKGCMSVSLYWSKKIAFILIYFGFTGSLFAQSINSGWEQELANSIETFKKCDQTFVNGVNPCGKFIGESVNTVFEINDFYSEKLGRYLSGAEIINYLKSGNQWKLLGYAYDQKALTEAQSYANENKAVIAFYMNEEQLGHVSLILPGKLTKSGSWGSDVPNSASFFINDQQRSYSNKGLSYTFTRSMIRTVMIYGREY